MDTKYYIGIDSGGTHTRALAALRSGVIVGSAVTGSANRNHIPREQMRDNLGAAVAMALSGLASSTAPKTIFIGTSGVSTDLDCRDVCDTAYDAPEIDPGDRVTVENDAIVAHTGAFLGGPGIVLIAGTGSACFGVNERGQRYWCGGWGALADDVGSAPWLGLRALQVAVRAEDGRMPATQLRDIVFDFLGLKEPREFIGRVHDPRCGLGRSDLGLLAPRVLEACRNSDTAAMALVREAAEELAALVETTAGHLFEKKQCDLILAGGLARSGDPFQTQLVATLSRRVPFVTVREPDLSPVHGAVLEALRADGVEWSTDVLANVAAHPEIGKN